MFDLLLRVLCAGILSYFAVNFLIDCYLMGIGIGFYLF